jgi:hypothetical protein
MTFTEKLEQANDDKFALRTELELYRRAAEFWLQEDILETIESQVADGMAEFYEDLEMEKNG